MKVSEYFKQFWLLYFLTGAAILSLAVGSSHCVTAMVENQPILRQNVIVIDAGHGGVDGGATSCTGVLESALNLQIALRLEDMLHLLGFETCMIRRTDVSIYTEGSTIGAQKVSDLKNRVKLVNEQENVLLVSIHQNIFQDSRYDGAQVFYNQQGSAKAWAGELQSAFIKTINPGSSRKSKPANGVYLMEHIQRPGLLVECGFLSNVQEEALLRTEDYQIKICAVIASTLSRCLSNT